MRVCDITHSRRAFNIFSPSSSSSSLALWLGLGVENAFSVNQTNDDDRNGLHTGHKNVVYATTTVDGMVSQSDAKSKGRKYKWTTRRVFFLTEKCKIYVWKNVECYAVGGKKKIEYKVADREVVTQNGTHTNTQTHMTFKHTFSATEKCLNCHSLCNKT